MISANSISVFTFYWILFALILFPFLLFVKQPYGRHIRKGWGLSMSNKMAWVVMELPSLLIITILFFYMQNFQIVVVYPVLLWFVHYFHRTLIFPLRIKTKGKQMPVIIVFFGVFFNVVNATINGFSLDLFCKTDAFHLSDYVRIIIGSIMFVGGMIINIYSDNQLIKLRKSATNGYQIPQNGLFTWISCPNYFGEIIEWMGFAIIAWNPAALAFALWTMVNLIPRAIDHHKWYKQKFNEYPVKRKAVIPFIL